jgi:hypothetical protein
MFSTHRFNVTPKADKVRCFLLFASGLLLTSSTRTRSSCFPPVIWLSAGVMKS